jgi:hypothetical protein
MWLIVQLSGGNIESTGYDSPVEIAPHPRPDQSEPLSVSAHMHLAGPAHALSLLILLAICVTWRALARKWPILNVMLLGFIRGCWADNPTSCEHIPVMQCADRPQGSRRRTNAHPRLSAKTLARVRGCKGITHLERLRALNGAGRMPRLRGVGLSDR